MHDGPSRKKKKIVTEKVCDGRFNVSSHFVIKEEVFIHKKVFTDPLA